MTELEFEALARAIFPVVILIFALRGRYWLLATVAVIGLASAMLTANGLPRIWTGRIAYVFYVFLAAHTLDITRHVHHSRRP